jgi:hypothetical protein
MANSRKLVRRSSTTYQQVFQMECDRFCQCTTLVGNLISYEKVTERLWFEAVISVLGSFVCWNLKTKTCQFLNRALVIPGTVMSQWYPYIRQSRAEGTMRSNEQTVRRLYNPMTQIKSWNLKEDWSQTVEDVFLLSHVHDGFQVQGQPSIGTYWLQRNIQY